MRFVDRQSATGSFYFNDSITIIVGVYDGLFNAQMHNKCITTRKIETPNVNNF